MWTWLLILLSIIIFIKHISTLISWNSVNFVVLIFLALCWIIYDDLFSTLCCCTRSRSILLSFLYILKVFGLREFTFNQSILCCGFIPENALWLLDFSVYIDDSKYYQEYADANAHPQYDRQRVHFKALIAIYTLPIEAAPRWFTTTTALVIDHTVLHCFTLLD